MGNVSITMIIVLVTVFCIFTIRFVTQSIYFHSWAIYTNLKISSKYVALKSENIISFISPNGNKMLHHNYHDGNKKIMKKKKKKSHTIYKTLSLRDFHTKQTSSEMLRFFDFFVLNNLSRGQRKLYLVNTII